MSDTFNINAELELRENAHLLDATAPAPAPESSWRDFVPFVADIETKRLLSPSLTTPEYLKIHENLLKSRKEFKAKISTAANAEADAQLNLLDEYARFHKYLSERDMDPWDTGTEASGFANVYTRIVGEATVSKQYVEKLRHQNSVVLQDIRVGVERERAVLAQAGKRRESQESAFSVFLSDQGKVLAVVEKAVARNNSKGNDFKRSHMYKTIVQAMEDSPGLLALPSTERAKHKKELQQILRHLELVECQTDELIERVLLKLKAIRSEEAEQNHDIEEQLSAQEGMNSDLDEITVSIDKNNRDIQHKTRVMKEDILAAIMDIKRNNTIKLAAIGLVCVLLMCLVGMAAYVYGMYIK